MSSGVTSVVDIIVPEVFTPYMQLLTEEKSRIIQSGAVTRDEALDQFLAGGGLTEHMPSFRDLDNDTENVSTSNTGTSTPMKIGTTQELVVRLSRNQSWSSADLAAALAGVDPADAIARRVASYWIRRDQLTLMATMAGVFANNDTATDAYHVQYDMTHDVSGSVFADGVTNFTAGSVIDATATMGDSMDELGMLMVHSIVYARMQKQNLIDFVPDSDGKINIPTYQGKIVIVDDGMPNATGVFQTWLLASGAVRLGMGAPKVPTETLRIPAAGNGGGQEVLFSRLERVFHPVGHAFIGANVPEGGPSNAATTGNLAAATSWQRAFPERKQVKIARLVTREY